MKILSMKASLSSSQKPNKLALQPIKACKSFEHFQIGPFNRGLLPDRKKEQNESLNSAPYIESISARSHDYAQEILPEFLESDDSFNII